MPEPLYLEPVVPGDEDDIVLKKYATAVGAEVIPGEDPSEVLKKACAAVQGVTYP